MMESEMRRIAFEAADENAWFWRQKQEFGKAAWFVWQMIKLKPMRTTGWRHLAGIALKQ